MTGPRVLQHRRAGQERIGRRVKYFGRSEQRVVMPPTRDQHAAIGQQRRGMVSTRDGGAGSDREGA